MSSDPLPIMQGYLATTPVSSLGEMFPTSVNVFLILFLVFLNGFFVAAEFAMVKVRNTQIETMQASGSRRAKLAANITRNLDAYLSACQLGITLASLGLGYIGEPAIAKQLSPLLLSMGIESAAVISTISFLIAFSIITLLHIVLGELAPKSIAIRKSEEVTLWTAAPLVFFYKLMYPFIWSLNGLANAILRMVGIQPANEQDAHTEEEIRILMKESFKSGLIDNTELALVDNIFEFAETHAREIMIPRTEMICLYLENTFQENREIALQEMHTRYPVCDGDKDNIIGFVHIKDFFKYDDSSDIDIRSIVRPITQVPKSMQISDLLKIMQKKRTQIAILIDEYGGTSGLVTLEDIMEEIVGEIQDEYDNERADVERIEERHFSVNGLLLLDDLNDQLGLSIGSEDYDTVGGWLYSMIEIPPTRNQRVVTEDGIEFIIEETDNLRISRIAIRIPEPTSEADSEVSVLSDAPVDLGREGSKDHN